MAGGGSAPGHLHHLKNGCGQCCLPPSVYPSACFGLVGRDTHIRELKAIETLITLIRYRHWIVPIIGSAPFGFALFIFFVCYERSSRGQHSLTVEQQGIVTYLALAYTKHAASALAANDFLRCAFGAA